MGDANPFWTSMFQNLSNDIKNFSKPLSFDPYNCPMKIRESI